MGKKKNKKGAESNVLQLVPRTESRTETEPPKDCLFQDVFAERKNLLLLYQALHPEDTDTIAADLDNIHCASPGGNGMYGRIAFRAGDRVIVVAEAPYGPAVPIQMYSFAAAFDVYSQHLSEEGVPIGLPDSPPLNLEMYLLTPEQARHISPVWLHVGGGEELADPESPALNSVVVTEKTASGIVREYLAFCRVRAEQICDSGFTRKAVHETIRISREQGYLVEYLEEHEADAIRILTCMFGEELVQVEWRRNYGREERKAGREEGQRIARIEDARRMLEAGRITEAEIQQFFPGIAAHDISGSDHASGTAADAPVAQSGKT